MREKSEFSGKTRDIGLYRAFRKWRALDRLNRKSPPQGNVAGFWHKVRNWIVSRQPQAGSSLTATM